MLLVILLSFLVAVLFSAVMGQANQLLHERQVRSEAEVRSEEAEARSEKAEAEASQLEAELEKLKASLRRAHSWAHYERRRARLLLEAALKRPRPTPERLQELEKALAQEVQIAASSL
jgi:F0F1-type ATP synthase membrane subunit b/b'